ncbi:MAG: toll/interleukin-1 receptor domain-containing protein, partial [Propionibacteriaceae bacterium]|nr:toll/interleukin-1 receptor domain-containing protein [Propionibacteriaceae bacterium]
MIKRPFRSAGTDQPYVFASYAHADSSKAYPHMERLHQAGFRLWYDEGLAAGSSSWDGIANAINGAAAFLLFLSPHAVRSDNVRREIHWAADHGVPIIQVKLTKQAALPDGVRIQVGDDHVLSVKEYRDPADFYDKLTAALPKSALGPTDPAGGPPSPTSGRPRQRIPLIVGLAVAVLAAAVAGVAIWVRGQADPAPTDPPATATASASPSAAASPVPVTPTAVDYLTRRLSQLDHVFYVYRDAYDGLNHFTQRMWMGSDYRDPPAMDELAAGQPYPAPDDGRPSTGVHAALDLARHSWGGYLFTVGQWPAGAAAADPMPADAPGGRYDLSGASQLVFAAKGDVGGEQVEFFTGGLGYENGHPTQEHPDSTDQRSTGYVTLSAEWTLFTIDLTGADLSRIGAGFAWVADRGHNEGAAAIGFSVDDIRFEFAEPRLRPVFLSSFEPRPEGSEDAALNSVAYLWDNAIASLALTYGGRPERARQIIDAMVYALDHDRAFTDGRLRNAYAAGDPHSPPGWLSPRGEEFARLSSRPAEDLRSISSATGNLAWTVLAFVEAYEDAPSREDYLFAARRVASFILSLKDPAGGFVAGYEGWDDDQQRLTFKSTEHNIDVYVAMTRLAAVVSEGAADYRAAAAHARAFAASMYDESCGCYATGTRDDGVTVNTDVWPLDANTWSVLAFGPDRLESASAMVFVTDHLSVGDGFDFNSDKDGVWFEGTAGA